MPITLDPIVTVHYATRQDIESEIGVVNVVAYASLDNTLTDAEVSANIERALTFADTQINGELAAWSYTLPLTGIDGTAIPTWVTNKLTVIAQKLAAWQLGQARDHTNQPVAPADQRTDLQNRYKWAMEQLDNMLVNTIPATTIVTDDSSPEVGSAGPDVDKQGCPLPTTVCATYGYGGRIYGYC
jgi:hypothetical protein